MAVTAETLRAKLEGAFPGAAVDVVDTTGGGDHFSAAVVSSAFENVSLVDRHRMIYAALGDAMRTDIHALALTAETPAERRNAPP